MSYVQEKDAASFKPADVTAVLADSFSMAYFDMVLGLATTVEHLGSWCESCPCHADLIQTVEAQPSECPHAFAHQPPQVPIARPMVCTCFRF